MNLTQVELGQKARVIDINSPDDIKKRLMELGMVYGGCVKPVFTAPMGEPVAYEIKGTLIALRNDTACEIKVEVAENES